MKTETIESILEIGEKLILKEGYNSVGLNKILTTANIPKGSFYYYFKNKEDFGLQVIQYSSKIFLAFLKGHLNDKTKTPKERMVAFFESMRNKMIAKECKEGCLLGNCSLELSDVSESFSTVISNEMVKWQVSFEECIQEGQEQGNIKNTESAKEMSEFILNSWEGAILRMKSVKNTNAIETFINFLKKYIL